MITQGLRTIYDLQVDCERHMADNGLRCDAGIIADGLLRRYSADEKKNKKDEWYVAHTGVLGQGTQYLNCTYGSWPTDVTLKFRSHDDSNLYSQQEREEFAAVCKQQREATLAQLNTERDRVAKVACKIWQESVESTSEPQYLRYAVAKGIEPVDARFGINPNGYPSLILPLKNAAGQIRTLQFISMNNNGVSYKTFLSGGQKRGNFHILGSLDNDEPIMITEGYATGASVYQACKTPVIIAFDAGNIKPVIEQLRRQFPARTITIAADADERGMDAAHEVRGLFMRLHMSCYRSMIGIKRRMNHAIQVRLP